MKKYYGNETEKAIINFGRGFLPHILIEAYTEVKLSVLSAVQQEEKRFLDKEWEAIKKTCFELIKGELDTQFPISLLQGGAGTSINLNINEVIAFRANELLGFERFDPFEDINIYQSTNDTFPTAVTIALYRKLLELEAQVIRLQEYLVRRENELNQILMCGRTEMQNALPITLGQVFGSWAGMIERDRWRIHKLKERIRTVPLGGTAIGTGYPVPQKVVFAAEKFLREITKLPLSRSQNLPDEVSNQDKWAELAGVLKIVAENLYKITTDLLIYTSSFVEELKHPELQAGSSIMAAKTNPVILEFVKGCAIFVEHEADKVCDYARNGQLQLNVFLPFIFDSFLKIFELLEKSIDSLIEKFFDKMQINLEKIEENLVVSNILLNSLVVVLGYNKVKEIFHIVEKQKIKKISELKNILLKETSLSKEEIDFYLDPVNISTFWRKK